MYIFSLMEYGTRYGALGQESVGNWVAEVDLGASYDKGRLFVSEVPHQIRYAIKFTILRLDLQGKLYY